MRTHAISLKGSTQQQRQELYDFLVAKGEPIYPTTELTKSNYTCSYFEFGTIFKKWGGAFDAYFTIISIPDFIAKFQEPKLNIRDYCIDCTDSTLAERRQIIKYLKSISEDVYSGTAFKDDTDLKGEIFGYDEYSQGWIAGIEETSHILTTKEFIAKFINTGDVMSTINVGDVYKNSMGKICTILNNSESSNIMYKHEDGKNFTTSSSNITKNWTKQPTNNIKPRGNYKVGDKVKIRADLTPSLYGMNGKGKHTVLTSDMNRDYAGKIATITKVFTEYYNIDLDKGYHAWVDGMFEDIELTTISKLQPGMKVRVRPDLSLDKDYYMSNGKEPESVTKSMLKRAGTVVTISKISKYGKYFIKEDRGEYNWTDQMFSEIITTSKEQPIVKYKIDKSKLKPGIVIPCDTFEKAVAITSLVDNTITLTQYSSYKYQTAIWIKSKTYWEYSGISYYKEKDLTIVPFEDILVQPTCELKVGDYICFNEDAFKELPTLVREKPNEIIGRVYKILDRPGFKDLIYYKNLNGQELIIDAGWITKAEIPTPVAQQKTELTKKRGLAFFKESGTPWTLEELKTICNYCGDYDDSTVVGYPDKKYIYDNGAAKSFMYTWIEDPIDPKITMSYEALLDQLKLSVAQQEPIKSIKKEGSFMSKLKATALTTVDQNKEAAIIAAKMEAGRVINKQVIKQAAKHVPFWAKGYLGTPLAPVVLANAVAMLGNHTGNPKVQKISELMLLAAADVTVQSFNLDQIINDILSGIKLPAGILDDAE